MLTRALRLGWPVPEEAKALATERMMEILKDGKSKKASVSASRVLLSMEAAEATAVQAVQRAVLTDRLLNEDDMDREVRELFDNNHQKNVERRNERMAEIISRMNKEHEGLDQGKLKDFALLVTNRNEVYTERETRACWLEAGLPQYWSEPKIALAEPVGYVTVTNPIEAPAPETDRQKVIRFLKANDWRSAQPLIDARIAELKAAGKTDDADKMVKWWKSELSRCILLTEEPVYE